MQIYEEGTLCLTVEEAKLTQDHDFLGKQDPYIKFEYNGQEYKTKVIEDGGKVPVWSEKFDKLKVSSLHETIYFKIYDEDIAGGDDLIGVCPVKVSSLLLNAEKKEQQDWFSVFLNNKRVGVLSLRSKFDWKEPKAILPDPTVEQRLEAAQQEESRLRNELEELQQELEYQEEEKNKTEVEITEDKKTRQIIEQQLTHYENHQAAFEDNSMNFGYYIQEIKISSDSVKVKSCNEQAVSQKAINLLNELKGANDKWLVADFQSKYGGSDKKKYAYAIFEFENPILVRGFGLRSANDDPSCDPKDFEVQAEDYLSKDEKHGSTVVWKKLHHTHKANIWTNRGQLRTFEFKQRLVSKLRLKVSANNGGKHMHISEFKVFC